MAEPHVRWVAAIRRAGVRHAARYSSITEFRDNNYCRGTTLCSKWRVWLNGERHNNFENLHQCGACWNVLRCESNAEEFFGATERQRTAAEQRRRK